MKIIVLTLLALTAFSAFASTGASVIYDRGTKRLEGVRVLSINLLPGQDRILLGLGKESKSEIPEPLVTVELRKQDLEKIGLSLNDVRQIAADSNEDLFITADVYGNQAVFVQSVHSFK
jgi:hypothetical protein